MVVLRRRSKRWVNDTRLFLCLLNIFQVFVFAHAFCFLLFDTFWKTVRVSFSHKQLFLFQTEPDRLNREKYFLQRTWPIYFFLVHLSREVCVKKSLGQANTFLICIWFLCGLISACFAKSKTTNTTWFMWHTDFIFATQQQHFVFFLFKLKLASTFLAYQKAEVHFFPVSCAINFRDTRNLKIETRLSLRFFSATNKIHFVLQHETQETARHLLRHTLIFLCHKEWDPHIVTNKMQDTYIHSCHVLAGHRDLWDKRNSFWN